MYVDAFVSAFRGALRLGEKVTAVERRPGGRVVVRASSGEASFDHVVVATHADTTLALLAAPTSEERALLGAFRYHPTTVTLHEDTSLLHPDPRLRASWNTVRRDGVLRITYLLNRVQPLATERELLLTLGEAPIRPEKVLRTFSYAHPIFDAAAIRAQERLVAHDGGAVSFCGAWAGHGFHEDGVAAAERAIGALRGRLGAQRGSSCRLGSSSTTFGTPASPRSRNP